MVCATLRQYSEAKKIPDRFLIHHGNLSTAIREDAEARLKDETTPCHTVTTATLELGIDIGKLERAFQIDAPATVSSAASSVSSLSASASAGISAAAAVSVLRRDGPRCTGM